MQRQERKRAAKAIVEMSGNKTPTRKSTRTKRPSKRSSKATKGKSKIANDLCDDEFVEVGDLFKMPALPDVSPSSAAALRRHSSIMSIIDADAADSLLELRTGLTPLKKNPCMLKDFEDEDWNKENIAPAATDTSSQLVSYQRPFPSIGPERKFKYPPPPKIKYSLRGSPTPVVQAKHFPSTPMIPGCKNIKACDIFSPSYCPVSMATPSSGLPLDSVPLCDSIPSKHNPANFTQSPHIYGHAITMSSIKPTPLVHTKKRPSVGPLTPLCFTETPGLSPGDNEFFKTAGMLLDSEADLSMKLPSFSPMTSSPDKWAV